MLSLWNLLKGKKTYLLAVICMAMVLLKAASEQLGGATVDWEQVMHQVLSCLMTMALRHGLGQGAAPSIDTAALDRHDGFDR